MEAKDLIGTWRLTGMRLTATDGSISEPWGADADGFIIYSPDGYMTAAVTHRGADGGRAFLSYAGPYRVEDGTAIHHIVVASDPALHGTDQRRQATLSGDRLTLAASPSMAGGPGSSAAILWRRARPA